MPTTTQVIVASAIVAAIVVILGARTLFIHPTTSYVENPSIPSATLYVNCTPQLVSLPNGVTYQEVSDLFATLNLYVKNTYPYRLWVTGVTFVGPGQTSTEPLDWFLHPWDYGNEWAYEWLSSPPPIQFYANPGDVFKYTGSSVQLVKSGLLDEYYVSGVPNSGVPPGYSNPFGATKQTQLYDQWPLVYSYLLPKSYAATGVANWVTQSLFVLSNFEPVNGTEWSVPYYLQVASQSGNYGVYFEYEAPRGGHITTGIGLVSQYNPAGKNLVNASGNIYYAYFIGNGEQLLYINNGTAPAAYAAGPGSLGYWTTYLGVARLQSASARVASSGKPILTFYDIVANRSYYYGWNNWWGSWHFLTVNWSFIEDVLYANLTWCRYEIVPSNPSQFASLWLSHGPLYALGHAKYTLERVECGSAARLPNYGNPTTLSYNSPFAVYNVTNPGQSQYLVEQMPAYSHFYKWLSGVPIGQAYWVTNLSYVTVYGSGPMSGYQYEGTTPAIFYVPSEPGAALYYIVFYDPFPGNDLEGTLANPNYMYNTSLQGEAAYAGSPWPGYYLNFGTYITYSNYSVDVPYYAPYVVGLAYFPSGEWNTFDYAVASSLDSYGASKNTTTWLYVCSLWFGGCWGYSITWGWVSSYTANFTPVPAVGSNYVGPWKISNGPYWGTYETDAHDGVYYPFNYNSFTYQLPISSQQTTSKKAAFIGSDVYYLGLFTSDTITIEGVPPGFTVELSVPGKTVKVAATSPTVVVNLLNYFTAYQLVKAEEDGGILVTLVPPPNGVLDELPDMVLVHEVSYDLNMVVPVGLRVVSACSPQVNSTSTSATLVIRLSLIHI